MKIAAEAAPQDKVLRPGDSCGRVELKRSKAFYNLEHVMWALRTEELGRDGNLASPPSRQANGPRALIHSSGPRDSIIGSGS